MEILKPIQPEPITPIIESRESIPKDLLDAGITVKNLEILNHLELKDEMFNPNVMNKVDFIASKIENLEHLQDIDMRLGHDGGMPRIDKIYSYLKLLEQSEKIQEKKNLIDKQLKNYE